MVWVWLFLGGLALALFVWFLVKVVRETRATEERRIGVREADRAAGRAGAVSDDAGAFADRIRRRQLEERESAERRRSEALRRADKAGADAQSAARPAGDVPRLRGRDR